MIVELAVCLALVCLALLCGVIARFALLGTAALFLAGALFGVALPDWPPVAVIGTAGLDVLAHVAAPLIVFMAGSSTSAPDTRRAAAMLPAGALTSAAIAVPGAILLSPMLGVPVPALMALSFLVLTSERSPFRTWDLATSDGARRQEHFEHGPALAMLATAAASCAGADGWEIVVDLVLGLLVGVAVGVVLGYATAVALPRLIIGLSATGTFLALAGGLLSFGVAAQLGSGGYVAAFAAGMVLRSSVAHRLTDFVWLGTGLTAMLTAAVYAAGGIAVGMSANSPSDLWFALLVAVVVLAARLVQRTLTFEIARRYLGVSRRHFAAVAPGAFPICASVTLVPALGTPPAVGIPLVVAIILMEGFLAQLVRLVGGYDRRGDEDERGALTIDALLSERESPYMLLATAVPKGSRLVGLYVAQLRLPRPCLVALVTPADASDELHPDVAARRRRSSLWPSFEREWYDPSKGDASTAPGGNYRIRTGDRLTLVVRYDLRKDVEDRLQALHRAGLYAGSRRFGDDGPRPSSDMS